MRKNGGFRGRPGRCVLLDGDGEIKGKVWFFAFSLLTDMRAKSIIYDIHFYSFYHL